MIKPTDGPNLFKAQFTMDSRQLGIMASAVKQEWFDILQHIMEEEIRLMNIHLMNSSTDAEALQAYKLVRGASMFYAGVMNRIEEITAVDAYNNSGLGTPENPETLPLSKEFE
jgi:hypothetical protein